MRRAVALTALGALSVASPVVADIPIRGTRLTSGLTRPSFITQAPGDNNRLFILEQFGNGTLSNTARIRIMDANTNAVSPTAFLSIGSLANGNEQGLLGLAFHPNYASNGLFYVNVTNSSGAIEVREYQRNTADVANPTPVRTILTFSHPQTNHNGGWLGFGPGDGYLYISSGDGGNFDDSGTGHTEPHGNAQDISSNLLGKILRIDVNGDDFPAEANRNYAIPASNPFAGATTGDDEIWHYGLRNPWRPSFDRQTHDLYIADVGQDFAEEIDFQPANSPGGLNFGWRRFEGTNLRPGADNVDDLLQGPSPHTPPIHEYLHGGAARSVTGGYVYRGDENPALEGTYFFADFISNRIWSFKYDGTTLTKFRTLQDSSQALSIPTDVGTIGSISSWGEDNLGRIYIVDRGGEIFRLIPALPGDANLDRTVDITDLALLATNWQTPSGATWSIGDFTDDGVVDISDLALLATNWQLTGGGPSFAEAAAALGLPGVTVPEPLALPLLLAPLALARRRRLR